MALDSARGIMNFGTSETGGEVLTPVPPLQKRGGQRAVVQCEGCKENFEF